MNITKLTIIIPYYARIEIQVMVKECNTFTGACTICTGSVYFVGPKFARSTNYNILDVPLLRPLNL